MAEEKKGDILTNRQIMMVAAEISVKNMKIIAEEYLGLKGDMIEELVSKNIGDEESKKSCDQEVGQHELRTTS